MKNTISWAAVVAAFLLLAVQIIWPWPLLLLVAVILGGAGGSYLIDHWTEQE